MICYWLILDVFTNLRTFAFDWLVNTMLSSVASIVQKDYQIFFKRIIIWVKVFKNGPSKIWGRQPLKNFFRSFEAFVMFKLIFHIY